MGFRQVAILLLVAAGVAGLATIVLYSHVRWKAEEGRRAAARLEDAGSQPRIEVEPSRALEGQRPRAWRVLRNRGMVLPVGLPLILAVVACFRGWFPWALGILALPSLIAAFNVHSVQSGRAPSRSLVLASQALSGASIVILFILAVVRRPAR